MSKPQTIRYDRHGRTLRARVNGGPDEQGRWRWRLQEQQGPRQWKGHGTAWARPVDIRGVLQKLHQTLSAQGPMNRAGSLLDLLMFWLAAQEKRSDLAESSLAQYTTSARRLSAEVHGLRHLWPHELTRDQLDDYVRQLRAEGKAETTIAQDMRILRMVWRWGQKQGDIEPDLVLSCPKVRSRARPRYTPSADDIEVLLLYVDHEPTRRMIRIIEESGARRNEVLALRWRDVRGGRSPAILFAGKTGPRVVPIGRELSKDLERRRGEPHEAVVQARTNTVRDHLIKAQQRAAQPPWTWHGMRRLAVMRMCREGIDAAAAASITGHDVETMFRYYREVQEEDRQTAAAALRGELVRGKVIPLEVARRTRRA